MSGYCTTFTNPPSSIVPPFSVLIPPNPDPDYIFEAQQSFIDSLSGFACPLPLPTIDGATQYPITPDLISQISSTRAQSTSVPTISNKVTLSQGLQSTPNRSSLQAPESTTSQFAYAQAAPISELTKGDIVGLGVGVSVCVVVLLLFGWFLLQRRQKHVQEISQSSALDRQARHEVEAKNPRELEGQAKQELEAPLRQELEGPVGQEADPKRM